MQFRSIIATVDVNDDLASEVLRVASDMAAKDNADLTAVSVWPSLSAASPAFSGEIAASSAAISQAALEQHRAGRDACEKRLAQLVGSHAPKAKAVVLDGNPADETSNYAAETGADLIVTGSHQRGFWGALFAGSASRDVIHEAPCAVLLVTKTFAKRTKK